VNYVRALAEFENEPPGNVRLDEAAVLRDAFSERSRFEVLIAEVNQRPAGMALFMENYSTWTARPGIRAEELFVEEQFRNQGVGRSLMAALSRIAIERNSGRIELEPGPGVLSASRLQRIG
jgi:GNAT superfamily N-acetyltransferase